MGGALSLASGIKIPSVDAVSAFYGNPDARAFDVTTIKCPVQAHFGNKDAHKGFSDPETANLLEENLKKAKVPLDFNRYENTGHAFMNTTGHNYNKEVADIAWPKTIAFFRQYLN